MAYVSTEYCYVCEQTSSHINRKCPICEDRKRRAEVAAWNALTVEERLQDLRRRVEALEAKPATY